MSGCLRVLPAQGSRGSRSALPACLNCRTRPSGPQTPRHLGPSLARNPGTSLALAASAASASYYTAHSPEEELPPFSTFRYGCLSRDCIEIYRRNPPRHARHHCRIPELGSALPSCLSKVSPPMRRNRSRIGWIVQRPIEVVLVCELWTQPIHPTMFEPGGHFARRRDTPSQVFCGRQASSRAPRRRHNMQRIAPSCRSSGSGFPTELASTSQSCSVLPWAAETEFPPGPIRRRLLPPVGTVVHVKRTSSLMFRREDHTPVPDP